MGSGFFGNKETSLSIDAYLPPFWLHCLFFFRCPLPVIAARNHAGMLMCTFLMSQIVTFPNPEEEELVTQEDILRLLPFRHINPVMFARRRREGHFPFVRISRKTYLYRVSEVLAALRKFDRPAKP